MHRNLLSALRGFLQKKITLILFECPQNLTNLQIQILKMNYFKNFWKTYAPYLTDVWQYLIIIVIFMIAGIVYLILH